MFTFFRSKKRKHKKDKKEKSEKSKALEIVDNDAIEHGGWWKCKKLSEITGTIAIEFNDRQYVKSLDDGTFILGKKNYVNHESSLIKSHFRS